MSVSCINEEYRLPAWPKQPYKLFQVSSQMLEFNEEIGNRELRVPAFGFREMQVPCYVKTF